MFEEDGGLWQRERESSRNQPTTKNGPPYYNVELRSTPTHESPGRKKLNEVTVNDSLILMILHMFISGSNVCIKVDEGKHFN